MQWLVGCAFPAIKLDQISFGVQKCINPILPLQAYFPASRIIFHNNGKYWMWFGGELAVVELLRFYDHCKGALAFGQ